MRALSSLCFVLLLLGLAAPTAAVEKEQLVVPSLQASGVDPNTAQVVTELVLEALLTRHGLHALGPSDVKDMLSNEQQKQLMGCDESKCMAELSGALGASKIVTGVVGKLGDAFVVTIKIADTSNAQVIGRASRRFAKIEQATEVIGPLVDELLGQKPRVASTPKILEDPKAPAAKKTALTVAAFCSKAVDNYKSALLVPHAGERLLAERRGLLEDLLFTPSRTELDQKRACLEQLEPTLGKQLGDRALSARSAEGFDAATVAAADWEELKTSLPILVEAYATGLDMERRGTGTRPSALPFTLKTGAPKPRANDAELSKLRAAYDAAQATLQKLLRAADKGDKAGFIGLFGEGGKKDAPKPRDQYVEVLKRADAANLDPCPWFVLSPDDLKARAAEYARSNHVPGCLRSVSKKDGSTQLSKVELVMAGKDWRVLALEL